jgi:hypothetical protein
MELFMKRFALASCVAVVGILSGFTWLGGWTVVSVSKIPDAWIAGKPLQLSWQVKQHGEEPVYGLTPVLEARSGSRTVRGSASEFRERGERGYRGVITFPSKGAWQVTINSGFGRTKAVLVPWEVVDSTTKVRGTVEDHLGRLGVAPHTEAERGRRMFVAKGCVTCHVHSDVSIAGEAKDFGPNLTGKQFPPAYLSRFLTDPSIKPSTDGKRMPNPGLREKDIGPLIAFINAGRRGTSTAARR